MSYATTQVAAKALLAEKGRVVTLTRLAAGAYDTATSSATAAETETATRGVVLPLSRGFIHTANTNIKAGDQQLLLPGDIDPPAIDDIVTLGADKHSIIEVSPLSPGGTVLLYDCVIRGAA